MIGRDLPNYDFLEEPTEEMQLFEHSHLSTQTIDLDSVFSQDVTQSGSFDVREVELTSFARLLHAMPIPVLLVDRKGEVAFANENWGTVSKEYHRAMIVPFSELFLDPQAGKRAQAVVHQVFKDRRPRAAKGWLLIGRAKIWTRMRFRSLRLGRQRFVLVPVQDLTLERRQSELQELHRKQLQQAHDELEKRVEQRTAEISSKNEQLQQEISVRKRVEKALRLSEERFRAVFESAEDLVFVKDKSLRYTEVNPAMLKLLGRSHDTVAGMTDAELLGQDFAMATRAAEQRVLAGQTIEMEHTVSFSGSMLTCTFIRVPLRDASGAITGLCGIGRNITERKSREMQPESNGIKDLRGRCKSSKMRSTIEEIRLAAKGDSICLFLGESGAGKDYLAQYLHDHSKRAGGPFFSINCAALPPDLAESELFGYQAGAFTGAVGRKRGLLELAEGGTLLLNEIGELSPPLQAKLLAFLDTSSFTRVGGEKRITVNARLVAATNSDLLREVEAGNFRQDLYYRLNVIAIKVPPLRERIEDLPDLVNGLLESLAKRLGRRQVPAIHPAAMEILTEYRWPGNVRELRNVLERAIILSNGDPIDASHIVLERSNVIGNPTPDRLSVFINISENMSMSDAVRDVKRQLITEGLRRAEGSVSNAARLLGISRDSLNHHIRSLGLRNN